MKKYQTIMGGLMLAVLVPAAPVLAGAGQAPQATRVKVKDRTAASRAVADAQAVRLEPTEPASADVKSTAVPPDPASDAAVGQASAGATAEAVVPAGGCEPPFKTEIAALFDRWNASLRSKDAKKVVANYAPGSVLIPTLSDRVRFTATEKEDYFVQFLKRHPEGRIDDRVIEVDCDSAVDSGLYTFRFGDGTQVRARYTFTYKRIEGEWLISSHHSSAMPEKPVSAAGPAAKATASLPDSPKPWVRFP